MRVPGADEATDRLADWARRSPWRERQQGVFSAHLVPVADALEREPAEVGEQLGPLAGQVSVAVFEDFLAVEFGDEEAENVVDAYLAGRSWTLGGPAKEFLLGLRDATPSIYEIVEIDRGSTVTVRDLVRGGAPLVVSEEMGSQTLALWDCVIARILTVGGARCFASGLLHCPRELARLCLADLNREIRRIRTELTRIVRKAGAKGAVTEREARDVFLASPAAGPFFTLRFVVWTVRQKESFGRGLENTDGQAILFSTVRFPLAGDEAEVARALDAVAEFHRLPGEGSQWGWSEPESPAPAEPRDAPRGGERAGGLRLRLGHLEITDGALLLHTNSAERADAAPPPTKEMQAVAAAVLEDHYRRTLDEPVPMLGNRTPRQAARTRKGRVEVVEWLKEIENVESRGAFMEGREAMDTAWLWEELKVPRPGGKP